MRIDAAYHEMHFKCQELTKECHDMQATCFLYSTIFAFVMLTIGLPIMLIAKIDFKKELKPWAVMLPITFAWTGYIVAQVYAWVQIGTFHKRLRHLD